MKLGFCYSLRESFQDAPWINAPLPSRVAFGRLTSGPDAPMRTRQVVALVSVCTLIVLSVVWWGAREPADPVEELALVFSERRFIEPRLTGGFAHAPCTPIDDPAHLIPRSRCSEEPSSESSEWRELASAIRFLAGAGRGRDARSLHWSALSDLVWPQGERFVARAVSSLEKAAQSAPGDARIRNDLAAALYVLAQERDEPILLVRALAEIGEAFRLAPELPEIRFNRALMQEKLFLMDGARIAWNEYLEVDSNSEWAEEARRRQGALAALPETWEELAPGIRAAVLRGDMKEVNAAVALSPQIFLEGTLEKMFGEWGDLVTADRLTEAAEMLRVIKVLGDALRLETGEPTVVDTVITIDQSITRANLKLLASELQTYRDGQAAYRKQHLGQAARILERSFTELERKNNPLAPWALASMAGVDISLSRYDQAQKKYEAVMMAAYQSGSKALAGRAAWGLGLVQMRQGHLSKSLRYFQEAVSAFELSEERQNRGATLELIAENLRFLGQEATAWEYRYRAAGVLVPYRRSIRLHNVLWEGGWAAVEEGLSRAGMAFLDEGVQLGETTRLPQRLSEALLWRSKIHLALGDINGALDDLLRAKKVNELTSDSWVKKRLAADLDYVEGDVRRRTDPAASIAPLSRSIGFYREQDLLLDLPGAYLSRFHALMDSGAAEEAEHDIERALQVLEIRRNSITDTSVKFSINETMQDLYDELLRLQVNSVDGFKALAVIERARALGTSSTSLIERLAAMPEDIAVLEYALVGDSVFVWLIYDGQIKKFRTSEMAHLESDVFLLVREIRRWNSSSEVDSLSKKLHSLLIPSEVSDLPAEVDLVIVPDRFLNTLPFAALKNSSTGLYMIQEREIRIAASAFSSQGGRRSVLEKGESKALLVAATEFDRDIFTDLRPIPGASREVKSLGTLYPGAQVLAGSLATKERLLAGLKGRRVFHFAGHAVFNPRYPSRSYFVLAPSRQSTDAGILLASEIAEQQLHDLQLVVLSACRTLGPLSARSGAIAGISRPFLNAGVGAVLGTLWEVPDRTAEHMLLTFHRYYQDGRDAFNALQMAQIDMIEVGHPPGSWSVFQAIQ